MSFTELIIKNTAIITLVIISSIYLKGSIDGIQIESFKTQLYSMFTSLYLILSFSAEKEGIVCCQIYFFESQKRAPCSSLLAILITFYENMLII